MSRKTFLTIVSLVAVCVGAFTLFAMLLNSKGVAPSEAGNGPRPRSGARGRA
jgi:hypothetical protein